MVANFTYFYLFKQEHGNRLLVWGQPVGWPSLKTGHRVWTKFYIRLWVACNWYYGLKRKADGRMKGATHPAARTRVLKKVNGRIQLRTTTRKKHTWKLPRVEKNRHGQLACSEQTGYFPNEETRTKKKKRKRNRPSEIHPEITRSILLISTE